MAKQTKKQAVGYCRVSSIGQQNNGTGLDRQEDTVKSFAKRNGYKIIKVYHEAFTGTESERPAFDAMLAEVLDNGCRTIIVESLDRLARDLAVQMQIIALLTNKGIALLSASTGQNVTESMESDPMMRAMVQMQGTFAELDKRLLVRKLKKGRDACRKRTGRCEGRKPYGFYPSEVPIVKYIKQLRRKRKGETRMGYLTIAKRLNAEGVPTRYGAAWSDMQVRAILSRKK